MDRYSVKKLAKAAGVSVRTLHLYDEMGLLRPLMRSEKNYRYYGRAELLRLQQILFYKALGFSLGQIADVLDDPEFDLFSALESHKVSIQKEKTRLDTLLRTIDTTIANIKNDTMLNVDELYEGLPKEQAQAWREEAKQKWGKAVDHSENHLRKKTKKEFDELKEQFAMNQKNLAELCNEDPTSEKVQKEIASHYNLIREFWGTAGSTDNQTEAYSGLGDLYVSDERYTMHEGKPQPQFAAFMNAAMKHFVEKNFKLKS